MKNNLIEIINNYQEYENTKWEGCQIKLKSMLDVIKTTPYYQLLLDMYKHIDEQRLYKSETHGINHNERVMLYSTFIAIKENLKEEDIKLLLYGAMYHDIGRKNDLEDEGHGYRSSKLIEKIISNLKEEDLKILKTALTKKTAKITRATKVSKIQVREIFLLFLKIFIKVPSFVIKINYKTIILAIS